MSAKAVRDDTRYDGQPSLGACSVYTSGRNQDPGVSANAVRDDTRYDSQPLATCPVDGTKFQPVGRRLFCTPRCRQQAFRLRSRHADTAALADVTDQLWREHRLIAQTVYECSSCLRFVSSKSTSMETARDEELERRVPL